MILTVHNQNKHAEMAQYIFRTMSYTLQANNSNTYIHLVSSITKL